MSDLQEAKEKALTQYLEGDTMDVCLGRDSVESFDAGWNAATEHHAAQVAEMERQTKAAEIIDRSFARLGRLRDDMSEADVAAVQRFLFKWRDELNALKDK